MKINIQSIKYVLVVALSLVVFSGCATSEAAKVGEVYICTGPGAKVYHSKSNCKGLRNCRHSIEKVQKSETDRRACKLCVKE